MDPNNDAAQKAADDAAKNAAQGNQDDKGDSQVDPKIAEIMKDPDAVQSLLKSKRDANAEAKELRLKLEKIERAQREAEEKALSEQGKHKELAERLQTENATLKDGFKKRLVDTELKIEAQAAGCVDPDAVVALANRSGIKVSDDLTTVEGAKESVGELMKSKPYLFVQSDASNRPAPGSLPPAPRGGFGLGDDVDKLSPRDLISKGLNTK